MLTLKRFWLWVTLFLTTVFVVLALAIWQPKFPSSDSAQNDSPLALNSDSSTDQTPAIPAEADPSYPAPAKKLHKVITDPDQQPVDITNIEQKISEMDQNLMVLEGFAFYSAYL